MAQWSSAGVACQSLNGICTPGSINCLRGFLSTHRGCLFVLTPSLLGFFNQGFQKGFLREFSVLQTIVSLAVVQQNALLFLVQTVYKRLVVDSVLNPLGFNQCCHISPDLQNRRLLSSSCSHFTFSQAHLALVLKLLWIDLVCLVIWGFICK